MSRRMAQTVDCRWRWSVPSTAGRTVRRPSRPTRLSVTAEVNGREGQRGENSVQSALGDVASRILEDGGAAQLQEQRTKPLKINRDLLLVRGLEF